MDHNTKFSFAPSCLRKSHLNNVWAQFKVLQPLGLSSHELFPAGEFFSDDDHIAAPTYDDDKGWEGSVKLETLLLLLRHIREKFPPTTHFISEVTFSEEKQHLKQSGLVKLLLILQRQDSSKSYPRDLFGSLKTHPPAEWGYFDEETKDRDRRVHDGTTQPSENPFCVILTRY